MDMSVFSRDYFMGLSEPAKYFTDNLLLLIDKNLKSPHFEKGCCKNTFKKKQCILGHNHATLYFDDTILGKRSIPSRFPDEDTCQQIIDVLRNNECIHVGSNDTMIERVVWQNYGAFDRVDIERMRSIAKHIELFANSVACLRDFCSKNYAVPTYANSLLKDSDCRRFFTWFCDNPLVISENLDIEEQYQLEYYYASKGAKMVPYHDKIVRFAGTSSLQEREILLILQILQRQNPSDLYILLDPYWSDEQFITFLDNVLMKKKVTGRVHIVLNRYGHSLNTRGLYGHWVYYCILEIPGIIIYGDSMPKSILVRDADKYISMIYERRHGALGIVNLYDVSSNPNYPKQPGDSEICGCLALLPPIFSINSNLWDNLVSHSKRDEMQWLRQSPLYKSHLTTFLQKCVIRAEVNPEWLFHMPSNICDVYKEIYSVSPARKNIFRHVKSSLSGCILSASTGKSTSEASTATSTCTREIYTATSIGTPETPTVTSTGTCKTSTGTRETSTVTSTGTHETSTVTSTGTRETSAVTSTGTRETSTVTSTGTCETSTVTSTGTRETSTVTSTGTCETSTATSTGTRETSTATSIGTRDTSTATSTGTRETSTVTSTGTRETSTVTSTGTRETSTATSTGTRETSTATSTGTRETSIATSTGTRETSIATSTGTRQTSTVDISVFQGQPQMGRKALLKIHNVLSSFCINETVAISSALDIRQFNGYHWKVVGDKNMKRKVHRRPKDATSLEITYKCISGNCAAEFICSNIRKIAVISPYRLICFTKSHSEECERAAQAPCLPLNAKDVPLNDPPDEQVQLNSAPDEHVPLNSAPEGDLPLNDASEEHLRWNAAPEGHARLKAAPERHVPLNDPSEGHVRLTAAPEGHVPLNAAPKVYVPLNTAPGEHVSLNVAPEQCKSLDIAPEQSLPLYAVPEERVLSDASPGEHVSLNAAPGEHVPLNAAPGEHVLLNAVPEDYNPLDVATEQLVPLKSISVPLYTVSHDVCPIDVSEPSLFYFRDQSKKLRRKYDLGKWQHGSNYNGVTTYKCDTTGCPGIRYIWLCQGNCYRSQSKDTRCCSITKDNNGALFVKYIGQHTSGCTFYDNLSLNNKATRDNRTLREKAHIHFKLPVNSVKYIPENLEGDEIFILHCNDPFPGKKLHSYINDGRSYSKHTTTSKELVGLFEGDEKVQLFSYSCLGSYVCNNLGCQYYQRFNVINQISVSDIDPEEKTCTSCSFPLETLPCKTKKMVAFQNKKNAAENEILIRYIGKHSCLAKYKIQETTKIEIENYFKENPNVKPSIAWYNIWSKKMREGASGAEIDQIVLAQVNAWVVSNAKANVRKQIFPHDSTVDALFHVKTKYVENEATTKYGVIMDIFTSSTFCISCNNITVECKADVCGICGAANLVDTGEFIFLSSKSCLETMIQMNYGNTLYGNSCHVDHQPGRTREYTTFEGVVYDPELKRIVNIFTFHMKRETEFHVAAALSYVNIALKTHFKTDVLFEPHGFVSDEAGGLLAGIHRIHPNTPVVTDDFHFQQNVFQVISRDVGSKNDIIRFLRFCQALQESITPSVYNKVLKAFLYWIEMLESRKQRLLSFIEWWDTRRSHWSRAFKNNDVEKHSLAESGNSMIARKDIMKNVSIDECIRFEISSLMKHHLRLEGLLNGSYKSGRGPSRKVLVKRNVDALLQRVRNYPVTKTDADDLVSDILKTIGIPYMDFQDCDDENIGEESCDPFTLLSQDVEMKREKSVILPKSPHKYTYKSVVDADTSNKSYKVGRPKKVKISLNDSFDDLSDMEYDEMDKGKYQQKGEQEGKKGKKLKKLHGQYKSFPKNWRFMEKKVSEMISNKEYYVEHSANLTFNVKKRNDETYPTRLVTLSPDKTFCSCEDFEKKQHADGDPSRNLTTYNCKHLVFVMRTIGIDSNEVLLRRHHLSAADISRFEDSQRLWLNGLENNSIQEIKTVDKAENKGVLVYVGDTLTSAQGNLRKKPSRWSAAYYKAKSTRGRKPQCQSNNREPHGLTNGQLCLRVEFDSIFKVWGKSTYMMKSEEKYFCCDSNCVNYPKSTFTNPTFSNFTPPSHDMICKKEINTNDYRAVQSLLLH